MLIRRKCSMLMLCQMGAEICHVAQDDGRLERWALGCDERFHQTK